MASKSFGGVQRRRDEDGAPYQAAGPPCTGGCADPPAGIIIMSSWALSGASSGSRMFVLNRHSPSMGGHEKPKAMGWVMVVARRGGHDWVSSTETAA